MFEELSDQHDAGTFSVCFVPDYASTDGSGNANIGSGKWQVAIVLGGARAGAAGVKGAQSVQ